MRFPSIVVLADRTREVLVRFPWTMAAGILAATSAIIASTNKAEQQWIRITAVAGLGLALSVALTLFAEERRWSPPKKAALNAAGAGLLVLFYLVWPGPDQKHEAIRYFQLSAGFHLLVATLPFGGQSETNAFWQYNRRLFLGFLRAYIFSMVLYIGLTIALAALDKLFGVDVPSKLYFRLYLVTVFVINTAIFLAAVPYGLRELASDTSYPRELTIFAQYILTPLVFIYLVILLAYLVKIVFGGEWPSGWIGWLVTSVAVAGLLGFLLVHPLRHDPREAWIRTYTRWLFIGLIPAALILLVAFWKRVLPYGLTELRLLGILLGFWLLGIAISYTLKQDAGIRRIPLTLALLLLLTLYGPFSVTRLAVASQGRRLKNLVASGAHSRSNEREASAALRFLLEHRAGSQIASAIRAPVPRLQWDSVVTSREQRDIAAGGILAAAGMQYVPEYADQPAGYISLWSEPETVTPISGYEWLIRLSEPDQRPTIRGRDTVSRPPLMAGPDTLGVRFDAGTGLLRITAGGDAFQFDLRRLADSLGGVNTRRNTLPPEQLRLRASGRARKAMLALESLQGRREKDSTHIDRWTGRLFLGRVH